MFYKDRVRPRSARNKGTIPQKSDYGFYGDRGGIRLDKLDSFIIKIAESDPVMVSCNSTWVI